MVTVLQLEPLYVVPMMTPDGNLGALDQEISDTTGDSAIFEHLGGKLITKL